MLCIFCEILAGRAPASFVYDDDRIAAFMTIHPTRPGEFVVIPKTHIDHFTDIPDELAAHLCSVAHRLSRKVRDHDPHDIVSGRHAFVEDGAVRFAAERLPTPPREELDRLAKIIGG